MFNIFQFAEKLIQRFLTFINTSLFLTELTLRKPSLIFIGDSHAYCIGSEDNIIKQNKVMNREEGILYLGPKTIYSISQNGFSINKIVAIILRSTKNLKLVICLGEIDVRCHLFNRGRLRKFSKVVIQYREKIQLLESQVRPSKIIILTPVPPSNKGKDNPNYPRVNSLKDRIKVSKTVSKQIIKTCSSYSVIDSGKILQTKSGSLKDKFTTDGCHVNTVGAQLIKYHIRNDLDNDRRRI
jgi:hypothetical protein